MKHNFGHIFVVSCLLFSITSLLQARPANENPLPEIPRSQFDPNGRNPFLIEEIIIKAETKPVPVDAGRLSNAEFESLKNNLTYDGFVININQPSIALVGGYRFTLNEPAYLDLGKADGRRLVVVAESITEKHVILRLLDGSDRRITLNYRPAEGPKEGKKP